MAKSRVDDETDDDAREAPSRGQGRSKGRSAEARRRRGRTIVAITLIGFVLVASAIVWRRSYGITQSRALSDLGRKKGQLIAERAHLEALIRDESSRTRLGPVVQALGMRVPQDQQVRILPR